MIGALEIGLGFALLLGLMFLGLHVATVMFIVAIVGAMLYLGQAAVFAFGTQLWAATEDFVLLSIPLGRYMARVLDVSGPRNRFERLIDTTTAMAALAIIQLLMRRLASY